MSKPNIVYDGSDVKKENLDVYYKNLFPFKPLYSLLSYGSPDPKYRAKREYSLTISSDENPDGFYARYKCCSDVNDFENLMKQSHENFVTKLDIGAIFNGDISRHREMSLEPIERELVFDIDMDSYNDVRTCCQDKKVCNHCFKFLTSAAKVLDSILRNHFGFQHIMFVFSGRRGIHCWVHDYKARTLSNKGREAVSSYLSYETIQKDNLGRPSDASIRHPVFTDAFDLIEQDFPTLFETQGMFKDLLSREKLLQAHFTEHKTIRLNNDLDAEECWTDLSDRQHKTGNSHINSGIRRTVLHYLYPRLDIEVSKQMNHLLKAPFCIHPATGRVCIPLDVDTIDSFDPDSVPTLGSLLSEIRNLRENNSNFDSWSSDEVMKKTSLAPYIAQLTSFVQNVVRDERDRRSASSSVKGELF